jgi:hypothetical protein
MVSRRDFFKGAGVVAVGAGLVSRVGAASLPELATMSGPATQPPPMPASGRPYHPVVTLNGWSLPWRMNNGVKEFHLVAEPVVREIAPGMKATGFESSSPIACRKRPAFTGMGNVFPAAWTAWPA